MLCGRFVFCILYGLELHKKKKVGLELKAKGEAFLNNREEQEEQEKEPEHIHDSPTGTQRRVGRRKERKKMMSTCINAINSPN